MRRRGGVCQLKSFPRFLANDSWVDSKALENNNNYKGNKRVCDNQANSYAEIGENSWMHTFLYVSVCVCVGMCAQTMYPSNTTNG